jgi:hypothetical protein
VSQYRELNAPEIVKTIATLRSRIEERFPGSSLGRLNGELLDVANEAIARTQWIRAPHVPLRIATWFLGLALVGLFGWVLLAVDLRQLPDFADFLQAIDAAISSAVFLGAAIVFLVSWENRRKRHRALRAIHELRALAHIVDMHQLTKDPDRFIFQRPDTASSPKRTLSPFELGRYLDYCSETLSLISKIAAIYVQGLDDQVILDAADEVQELTTGLNAKIWQKIAMLRQHQPAGGAGATAARSAES